VPIPVEWGIQPEERALPFPCDDVLGGPHSRWFRGITIHAPPDIVFRWLCQLRVSSYTYGRKGPQTLPFDLDDLAVGQRFMGSFDLVGFERPRHLTISLRDDAPEARHVKGAAVSYLIGRGAPGTCRLLVKTLLRHHPGLRGLVVRLIVPWGDLLMMRKQLLNIKRLAQNTAKSDP
jgi:hypothetical protein